MNLFELFVKIGVDDQASSRISKIASGLGKGLQTAAKVGVAAIGAASTAIVALGKIGFDYNKQIETYTTNFEVMMGNAEAAARKVEELKEMGARTPFELGDLANATQTLLAFNVSADESTGVLSKLGDISLGNVQKLESLTRAYGKMNASQKVTLEDINMMIDAGFNPLLIVAENTGETMEEVYARISDGSVSFEEIQEAITQATSAGGQFYQGMEKASQTTEGLISTLKDNATALVGEVFIPISDGIAKKVLPGAINAINKLSDAFRENGIDGMVDATGEIIAEALGTFTKNLPQFVKMATSIVGSLLSGIRDNLDVIADGAIETIETMIDGIGDMLPDIIVTGVLLLAKLAEGVVSAIPKLVSKIPEIIMGIVNGFAENSGEFLQIGKNIVDKIGSGISSAWDGLVSWFNGIWDSLFGNRSVNVNVNKSSGGSGHGPINVNGSHALGLDYVPFDGYIAELHKGERILTAKESKSYGTKNTYGDIIIQVSGAEHYDENSLAEAIAEKFQMMADGKAAVYA